MLPHPQDTICAISTPHGSGGIAVIRVSGNEAFSICRRMVKPARTLLPEAGQQKASIGFGRIYRGSELIDEVLVSVFRAPYSYTGHDTVEINCHGSPYIQQEILKLLLENGCRLAAAGEFTQRAYFSGKLDLSQAEAVADLIAASSAASHRVALQQMRGGFSHQLAELNSRLLEFVSLVELELDFGDEDVEFADRQKLKDLAEQIASVIRRLSDSFSAGNAIRNGIPVAIVGETNAGKSTLLNRLLHDDKAIVSDVHGTTRDAIEDTVSISGLLFRLIDTAGLRDTHDAIEQIGIERALRKIEQATIVLWVIDLTTDLLGINRIAAKIIGRTQDKKLILVLNKADLLTDDIRKQKTTEWYCRFHEDYLVLSALSDADMDTLERKLVESANIPQIGENEMIVTSLRHYESLVKALQAIERVIEGLNTGISGDFLSQDIRECVQHLNTITGKQIGTDDVLGNIFSRFCIGK